VGTHKEFVLRALERVIALEKGESDEQTADDVQHYLGHQVRRTSPIMCEIAHEQRPYLIDPRRRESGTDGGRHRRRVPPFSNNGIDFVANQHRLRRVVPNLVPICLAGCRCPCTNDVKDELRPVQHIKMDAYADQNQANVRVLLGAAVTRSIPFEILDEGHGAGPNITKVDGFTTRSQQEQPIKDLEKFSGGLLSAYISTRRRLGAKYGCKPDECWVEMPSGIACGSQKDERTCRESLARYLQGPVGTR